MTDDLLFADCKTMRIEQRGDEVCLVFVCASTEEAALTYDAVTEYATRPGVRHLKLSLGREN